MYEIIIYLQFTFHRKISTFGEKELFKIIKTLKMLINKIVISYNMMYSKERLLEFFKGLFMDEFS